MHARIRYHYVVLCRICEVFAVAVGGKHARSTYLARSRPQKEKLSEDIHLITILVMEMQIKMQNRTRRPIKEFFSNVRNVSQQGVLSFLFSAAFYLYPHNYPRSTETHILSVDTFEEFASEVVRFPLAASPQQHLHLAHQLQLEVLVLVSVVMVMIVVGVRIAVSVAAAATPIATGPSRGPRRRGRRGCAIQTRAA